MTMLQNMGLSDVDQHYRPSAKSVDSKSRHDNHGEAEGDPAVSAFCKLMKSGGRK